MSKPFANILAELVSADVDFVIVGGVAVNAHGHSRNTFDLDIIVRFDRPNVERIAAGLKDCGYSPRMPVNPVDLSQADVRANWQSRNMVVLSFIEGRAPYTVIDIFIDHPIEYDQLVHQSVRFVYEDVAVRMAGIEHLIELKERAQRPKDIEDLKFLYAILDQQKEGLR